MSASPGSVRPSGAGTPPPAPRVELERVHAVARAAEDAMCSVIEGKRMAVRTTLTVLLAGGHLLVEDVPGVGKTLLAKALARTVGSSVNRIQFTPDLLPSDVTGVSVFHQDTHRFEFRPGAIFANVVVADEINRASPKTQSALLEAMAEGQVSVDGETHGLPEPFLVLATQNPIEMEGTYPLPEAQRDRFTARVSMGYPDRQSELRMLAHHGAADPLADLAPVTTPEEVAGLIRAVSTVHASEALQRYIVDLVTATRESPRLHLGASPRAGLQLLRTARAHAALAGREHVLPDDVQALAVAVLAHRVVLGSDAELASLRAEKIIADLVAGVPVPR
ncbi:MoxR-like ATPase [Bogoriella caseilytica]|uniref:MoxR-like ATPase n=2 Tax=Bogoriella caseilytica TaxID=56055 RepID=A0A3N2BGR5_9MICO|nr:MoxR-like ATPase [Bogoriella caseilytica]